MKSMNNYLFCVAIMMGMFISQVKAQTKYALLVGISDYGNVREDPEKWSNISGANDVQLLSPLFKKQGYKVTTLMDCRATYANIKGAIRKVTQELKSGDLMFLHFSLHGQPFEDLNGDEQDGWDEALIPYDAQMHYVKGKYEGKNHLVDDELDKYITVIRKKLGANGCLYVVLDACHSGTSSRGDGEHIRGIFEGFSRSGRLYSPDRNKETNDYFKVSTADNQSPVVFIEACRSYQVNKEILDSSTKKWYGPLSYYIAKAMDSYAIDKSGKWIEAVKLGMMRDRRVRKQNMVIETSR